MKDEQVLAEVLDEHGEKLSEETREAFEDWRSKRRFLTPKMKAWLMREAERFGVVGAAPAENVFSAMSPEKQARQREAAKRVRLPWEK